MMDNVPDFASYKSPARTTHPCCFQTCLHPEPRKRSRVQNLTWIFKERSADKRDFSTWHRFVMVCLAGAHPHPPLYLFSLMGVRQAGPICTAGQNTLQMCYKIEVSALPIVIMLSGDQAVPSLYPLGHLMSHSTVLLQKYVVSLSLFSHPPSLCGCVCLCVCGVCACLHVHGLE
jgi:hypothetical protein